MSNILTKDQIVNSNATELKKLLSITQNTNCTYCKGCTYCTDCKGCTYCTYCKGCWDCTGCTDCWDCKGCKGCTDCKGCTYCWDCKGCTDCTWCYKSQNQENKKYVFCNIQLTEEEYFDALRKVR